MADPYVPKPPVEVANLPSPSVTLLMMEAWLERQIIAEKPKKRRRMIRDLYAIADELESLGSISRLRSFNPTADRDLARMRHEAAGMFKAIGDMVSRRLMEER